MAGFKKGELLKVKRDILKNLKENENEITSFTKMQTRLDIVNRDARDTDEIGNPNSLRNSIFSKLKVLKTKAILTLGVKYHLYPNRNNTSPSYTPDKAPNEPIPSIPNNGKYGNTIKAAIYVLYGLGSHRKRGPRNFIYKGFKAFTDKYKLKRK